MIGGIFGAIGIGLPIYGGYKLYNTIDDYDVEEEIRLAIKHKGHRLAIA
jgi:hypothetical protein